MCISSVEQVSSSKDCPTLKKNGCVVSDYVHVSLRVHAMEGIIYTPLGAYWGGGEAECPGGVYLVFARMPCHIVE